MNQYLIQPYNQLLKKIVHQGTETDSTLALYDQRVLFDLRSLNAIQEDGLHRYLFLPNVRGGYTKTSMKYAITEAVWYQQQTQEINTIAQYGKIWNDMVNEKGLVNSNYGYQIANNQNVNATIQCMREKLLHEGQAQDEFYIINKDNQHARHDCVCNNKIAISVNKCSKEGTYEIDANVYARSIDVMFGLPYDTFAALGFMNMIAHELEQDDHIKQIRFNSLAYDIINVHWYLRDRPIESNIEHLSNSIQCIDSLETPYSSFDATHHYQNVSDEEVKDIRNFCYDRTYSYELKNDEKPLQIKSHFPKVIKSKPIKSLKEAIRYVNYMVEFSDDPLNHLRIDDVKDYLIDNCFDRKAVIMDDYKNLVYIYYHDDSERWHATRYNSLYYETALGQKSYTFYTDGSYTKKVPDYYSWSFIVDGPSNLNQMRDSRSGVKSEFVESFQVGGELQAVLEALKYCLENHIHTIHIVHDYLGAKSIVDGSFKPRSEVSKYYLHYYSQLYQQLEEQAKDDDEELIIQFKHVRGHTGIEGNELADDLAIRELRKLQK